MTKNDIIEPIDKDLQNILIWAKEKRADESQPPWACDSYDNLISAIQSIVAGRESTITMEDAQLLDKQLAHDRQQVDRNDRTNITPLQPRTVRVQMPI